ncbi:G-D-S-L family lipolytic protein [Mariniflexile sp.]|uniref:G-D-S-L family lipolytic protein n=1 Tax=Mariniflexile sp. TaxID=1979402 RepID=UPI0035616055
MTNTKYIWLLVIFLGFAACNDIEDVSRYEIEVTPELSAGTVDFSSYVALGASFSAGFTDSALFISSQTNSFPNMLSQQFSKIGGGTFTQPLMNDNIGGIAYGGVQLAGSTLGPRLVFGGSGPVALSTIIGPVTSTTDLAVNNLKGPFNNMGVPGAKSYHLLFNGYGNIENLSTKTANPYFIRMASSPTATMLGDAMAKNPTFFTLSEIGGNDVLGYALSGGDGTDVITPSSGPVGVGFDATFSYLVTQLTSNGAKGVVTNVPYITDLPHFTTVPYNALAPALIGGSANISALNAQLYGPLNNIFSAYGEPNRVKLLSATAPNPLLINDENATNRSAEITAALTPTLGAQTATAFGAIFGKARQATAADLLVLPLSTEIGKTISGAPSPVNINGVTYPLEDKWVLIPSEQAEIAAATDAYNTTIASIATSNANIALVNLNTILQELASTGISFDAFTMNANLVTGGAIGLDGIHLTARGYAYMANKFLEAIDAKFGSNFIASGNVVKAGDYPTNYSPLLN